jgi:hypothetical protein
MRKEDGLGTSALFLIIELSTIDTYPGSPLFLGSVALLHGESFPQAPSCMTNRALSTPKSPM